MTRSLTPAGAPDLANASGPLGPLAELLGCCQRAADGAVMHFGAGRYVPAIDHAEESLEYGRRARDLALRSAPLSRALRSAPLALALSEAEGHAVRVLRNAPRSLARAARPGR